MQEREKGRPNRIGLCLEFFLRLPFFSPSLSPLFSSVVCCTCRLASSRSQRSEKRKSKMAGKQREKNWASHRTKSSGFMFIERPFFPLRSGVCSSPNPPAERVSRPIYAAVRRFPFGDGPVDTDFFNRVPDSNAPTALCCRPSESRSLTL